VGGEKDVRELLWITVGELDRAAETAFSTSSIIEEHGRRTEVESLLGGGTTFTMWLPVPEDADEGEN
jgi:hypothetical protein